MEVDVSPFVNAGIPGVLLVWFMFRLERTDPEEASALSKALYHANGEDE